MKKLIEDIYKNRIALILLIGGWFFLEAFFHRHCPMVILTGLPCPGCGLTRAVLCVITLDLAGAWHINPSVFLWIPLLIFLLVNRYVLKKPIPYQKPVIIVVLLATIAIYIYRMLTEYPSDPPMSFDHRNLISYILWSR